MVNRTVLEECSQWVPQLEERFLYGVVFCPKRNSKERRKVLIQENDFVRDDEVCGKCMACVCVLSASCDFVLVQMCQQKFVCPARI